MRKKANPSSDYKLEHYIVSFKPQCSLKVTNQSFGKLVLPILRFLYNPKKAKWECYYHLPLRMLANTNKFIALAWVFLEDWAIYSVIYRLMFCLQVNNKSCREQRGSASSKCHGWPSTAIYEGRNVQNKFQIGICVRFLIVIWHHSATKMKCLF